jgi:hypothetical protein
MRLGPLLCCVVLPYTLAAAEFTCPVTKPQSPPFVAPAPYEPNAPDTDFWYGTSQLWTGLPLDGIWAGLPYTKNEGYGNKLFLWEAGYDGLRDPQPDIIVVTRRLDKKAPLWSHRSGTNALFPGANAMLTGVNFPTLGCWEVSAYHAGHTLTFVLSIH